MEPENKTTADERSPRDRFVGDEKSSQASCNIIMPIVATRRTDFVCTKPVRYDVH